MQTKACLQLLLSVSDRFRTRGLQKEAEILVQRVAKEKGWSKTELSDRTVPTAGLQESGELQLDFGSRLFTLALNERVELIVRDGDGTLRKSLPKAGKSDSEELVKRAHKLYRSAKKELKSVLKLQTRRLQDAMACQRGWLFQDWKHYLYPHPIMGRLVQRLLWYCPESGRTFRPLDDGSLSDWQDEEVKIDDRSEITLSHPIFMDHKELEGWKQHLLDYGVIPAFDQLGREVRVFTEEELESHEYLEFRGHLLENFVLRGQLTKRGYSRGEVEDGGAFFEYTKTFPTLNLSAVIRFSGTTVPEENEEVALTTLSFEKNFQTIPLSEVPQVLRCECRNNLKDVAQSGPGFDPNWRRFF